MCSMWRSPSTFPSLVPLVLTVRHHVSCDASWLDTAPETLKSKRAPRIKYLGWFHCIKWGMLKRQWLIILGPSFSLIASLMTSWSRPRNRIILLYSFLPSCERSGSTASLALDVFFFPLFLFLTSLAEFTSLLQSVEQYHFPLGTLMRETQLKWNLVPLVQLSFEHSTMVPPICSWQHHGKSSSSSIESSVFAFRMSEMFGTQKTSSTTCFDVFSKRVNTDALLSSSSSIWSIARSCMAASMAYPSVIKAIRSYALSKQWETSDETFVCDKKFLRWYKVPFSLLLPVDHSFL